MEQLYCVACIVEAKVAVMSGQDPAPGVRPAIALIGGQTTCAEHIVIQQQSSLTAPNGQPLMVPGQ